MTLDFTRRSALHVLGASASIGANFAAHASSRLKEASMSDFESFAQSSRKNPWTLGWQSVSSRDVSTKNYV